MAFSALTDRGTATEKTSDTSISISPNAAIAVGKLAILWAVTDNPTATDGATTDHSVTDTDGHTWTRIAEHTAAGGGASSGVCASLWGTVATQEIGTADSVNLAVGSAVTAKTVGLMEVTMTASAFAVDGSNQTLNGADGSATTLGSLANVEHLWLNLWGAEGVGSATAPAADADYTFINANGTSGGGGATNIRGALVARIFTGTTDTATREGDSSTTEIQILAAISEASSDRVARSTWAEMEIPNAPRLARVTWAELQTGDAPRLARITWTEMEVPTAPRLARVRGRSWRSATLHD